LNIEIEHSSIEDSDNVEEKFFSELSAEDKENV